MTRCLYVAPGRSSLYSFKVVLFITKQLLILRTGGANMINVTDEALEQINTELNNMKIDLDNPYIRLQMIVG